jgi:hypothetical protein
MSEKMPQFSDATDNEAGIEMLTPRRTMLTAEEEHDKEGRWVLKAYRREGEVFVIVDSNDPDALESLECKNAAYSYRLLLGLGNAGMEPMSGLIPVSSEDPIPTSFKVKKGDKRTRIYRREFKFNPGI